MFLLVSRQTQGEVGKERVSIHGVGPLHAKPPPRAGVFLTGNNGSSKHSPGGQGLLRMGKQLNTSFSPAPVFPQGSHPERGDSEGHRSLW